MIESGDANSGVEISDVHKVKRIAYRASYDVAVINEILDAAYICNIAFIYDGLPSVVPMTYWRDGEFIYFHSARGGRFEEACQLSPLCVSITLFDGLVLGHSPINHSVNYRSVIAHGRAGVIDEPVAKVAAMRDFFAKTMPGRWETLRDVRDEEIGALTVFKLRLDQAVAKIRNEFPDREDHMPEGSLWTGILPATLKFETPVADERFPLVDLPDWLNRFASKSTFHARIDRRFKTDFIPL